MFTKLTLCDPFLSLMLCVRDVLHPYLILNGEKEEGKENDGRAGASVCGTSTWCVAHIGVVLIPVALSTSAMPPI